MSEGISREEFTATVKRLDERIDNIKEDTGENRKVMDAVHKRLDSVATKKDVEDAINVRAANLVWKGLVAWGTAVITISWAIVTEAWKLVTGTGGS